MAMVGTPDTGDFSKNSPQRHGAWHKPEGLSDDELLAAVRSGSSEAYGLLFARHKDAALRTAGRYTSDWHLAADAVDEVFTSIFAALAGGAGPTGSFAGYLHVSVRRETHRQINHRAKEIPTEDHGLFDIPYFDALDHFNDQTMKRVFESLPLRWQYVLWHIELRGVKPRHVAPRLGLSPNATVALHRRAKTGLRTAFLLRQARRFSSTTW